VVAPVRAAGPDEPEPVADVPALAQGREPGEEVARRQVPGRPEEDQALDHAGAAVARARLTPLAITPIWLNACGKSPVGAPLDGSIVSDSSPSGLARAHSASYNCPASSSRPWWTRLSTSQKLHSRNAPSSPASPSGDASCR